MQNPPQDNRVWGQILKSNLKMYTMPTKKSQERTKVPRGVGIIISERTGDGSWYLATYISTTGQGVTGWLPARQVGNIIYNGNPVNPMDIKITEYDTYSREEIKQLKRTFKGNAGTNWGLTFIAMLGYGSLMFGAFTVDSGDEDLAMPLIIIGGVLVAISFIISLAIMGSRGSSRKEVKRLNTIWKNRRTDYQKRNLSDIQAHAMKAGISIGKSAAIGGINEYFEDN